MKRTILKILRSLLFLSIGILLLYFAFKGINLSELWADFINAKYGWILLAIFFATIAFVSRAYRWNLLIEPLNYKPSFKNTFYSLMVGYLANYAFPRIGEITRCGTLAKVERIPADKLLGTVIVERVIDLLMLFILFCILLISKFDFFGNFMKANILNPLLEKLDSVTGLSVYFWLILFSIPVLIIVTYYTFRSQLSEIKIIRKTKDIIKGVFSGFRTVFRMKRSWEFLLYSIIIWASYWLMSYVAVFALPATSSLNLIDGLFILVIGSLGFIAPVQGGIGAFHWILSVGLTIYKIPKADGLAFATIIHGSQALWTILLGAISLLILFIQRRKPAIIKS